MVATNTYDQKTVMISMLQLGPVFTLYIAGKRMTYLTEEEDYNKYFIQSEYVDFQKAVHLFVANAGKFSDGHFNPFCFNVTTVNTYSSFDALF